MTIVIIEDEVQTAWDLKTTLGKLRPDYQVKASLDSVESSVEWFSHNQEPDLIFSDIQLGDGLSFDIFRKIRISCPVIFCTAYDEYAIRAFQNNGIDYLLKPINEELLKKSLAKVDQFRKAGSTGSEPSVIARLLQEIEKTQVKSYKTTFLVSYRDKLIPVNIKDISCFNIKGEHVQLITHEQKQFYIQYSMDQLESMIDPGLFFRANRQNLVAYHAIKEIEHLSDRKLMVMLSNPSAEPVSVGKAKATEFLKWMEEH